jgi:hypothetical protein
VADVTFKGELIMSSVQAVRSMLVSICLIVSLMAMAVFGQTPTPATGTTATSGTSGTTATTATTATTTAAAPVTSYELGSPLPQLRPNANQIDAITITAKTGTDPEKGMRIKAKVVGDDVLVYSKDGKQGPTAVATTDSFGVAKFSIVTVNDHPANTQIQMIPIGKDPAAEHPDIDHITTASLTASASHLETLGSKLSYLQLFTGTTFTNNYDNTGKNTGFGSGGPIIRLTFDTMWKHQRHPSAKEMPICDDVNASTMKKIAAKCNTAHTWSDGAWHTDLNIEFTKFPFGLEPKKNQPAVNGPLENAFSGTVGATWQPNRWSHYDERDSIAVNDKFDPAHFDAYRWELFGKTGVTTRAEKNKSGDETIDRINLGVRFTHRRSFQPDAAHEDRNLEPIRFIEISGGVFSNWQGKHGVPRVIVDGGLRLGALSNDVFPIYLGAHLNTGPGPDDLRVFIGVLMKLDKLANLVRNAGVPTSE